MGFGLLAPAALAALVALLLPLLLHLARRDATRPTPFAALRWLRERPRPRRRLRFDDWSLLLVRLLLLGLLALWLAWPVQHDASPPSHWTVVVPGVAADAIPDVADDVANVRWLAPGFPEATADAPDTADGASVSSLLRELDMRLPAATALTVVVPETVAPVDGGRVALSRPVDWRIVPAAPDEASTAALPPRIDVFGIAEDDPALRVLEAVARAWRPDDADALRRASPGDAPRADAVIAWWGSGALPAQLRDAAAGRVVLLGPAADTGADRAPQPEDALFERGACGGARCIRATRALDASTEAAVLDPAFADRLRVLLRDAPAPTRIQATDLAPDTGVDAWPATPRDLRPWWALLVALVFALERWMAASARRNRVT
ncbi:hypothetical protein AO715_13835 [Xanthomonas sp. Mitacek01]|nr:hypothetical protein AO715_13835 [Xanthomonas sp. Mitacek01]